MERKKEAIEERWGRIVAPLGTGAAIAKALGVTKVTVSKAMNGRSARTDINRRIRFVAVKEFGGVEI